MKFPWKPQSLRWLMNISLAMLTVLLALALFVQGMLSDGLVNHKTWQQVLESSTRTALKSNRDNLSDVLPGDGALKGWLLSPDRPPPADMPPFVATLKPGYYSEGQLDDLAGTSFWAALMAVLTPRWGPFAAPPEDSTHARNYSVLVTPTAQGNLIMALDLTELENEQNKSIQLSLLFLLCNLALIAMLIWRLYLSLTQPVEDLARRMRDLDPLNTSQRLPTTYRKTELNTIAREANEHLERVELAVGRERRLLDQASHEFRTPLAIISGAADILQQQQLPARSQRPLHRIEEAVDTLSQIMDALLYLSREPGLEERRQVTVLQGLLPQLVRDHTYLLAGKPVRFALGSVESRALQAPESMVRIAVGNLLRNAAEHTHEGEIRVSLRHGTLSVRDSGSGFDTAQVARRYTESLKQSHQPGSGLGLFLVQRICDRFNWKLTLTSTASVGTCATIDFEPS